MTRITSKVLLALSLGVATVLPTQLMAALPSWNEGSSKQSIISYVTAVTQKGTADFIPVKDCIAVFDNDGTLWSEQPDYFQLFFAIDRVKALASQHPEWKMTQPFKAVLELNK